MNTEIINSKKTGNFIFELRKEKHMTQEELSKLIPISRQAVSKWERGETIPDSATLLKLSEIFNVSINEILYGEKILKNDNELNEKILLNIYEDRNITKRKIKFMFLALLLLLIAFLLYYFITSYKSIKIYTISTSNSEISNVEGLFIKTNSKLYLKFDDINFNEHKAKIKKITLYYIDEFGKEILICSTFENNIKLIDYIGYNEYFDISKIDYIIENMFVRFEFENKNEEIVKLIFTEDYTNNKLFLFNKKSIGINIALNDAKNESDDLIIKLIKNNFNKTKNGYEYKDIKNNNEINAIFKNEILIINVTNDKYIEEWQYNFNNKLIIYDYSDNHKLGFTIYYKNNSYICLIGSCVNYEANLQKFWDYLNAMLY